MPNLPEREELEYKEKEMLVNLREQFERSSKIWFISLIALLILAVPLGVILKNILARQFIGAYDPPEVYENPHNAVMLEVSRSGILQTADGNYSAYAQVLNPNPSLAAWQIDYSFVFRGAAGQVLEEAARRDFLLPQESKFFVLPKASPGEAPAAIDVEFRDIRWSPEDPEEDFEFEVLQERSGINSENNFFVEALIRNPQGFTVREVQVKVIVFNSSNQEPVAVNQTVLDHLEPFESRFFRLTWPGNIGSHGRIEISPEINPYLPGLIFDSGDSLPVR